MRGYLEYNVKKKTLDVITDSVYTAVITYMVIIKGLVSTDLLTVSNVMEALSSFIVFYYIKNMMIKFYKWLIISATINLLIDLLIITLLVFTDNVITGSTWVFVVIPLYAMRTITSEKKRRFEDRYITTMSGKKHLELVRKIGFKYEPIFTLIGSSIAYIFLSIFNIDIIIYALIIWCIIFILDLIELKFTIKLNRENTIDIFL